MSQSFVNTAVATISFGLVFISSRVYCRAQINISATLLQQDDAVLKKYVMKSVAADIKQAKKAGKSLAHTLGGVSNYAFDSIPWLFFADEQSIKDTFTRLCDDSCVRYIQEGKEEYKKNIQRTRPRLSKSQLGEFLHRRLINAMNISDEYKQILKASPEKTDEFVTRGIVSKDEYMLYNLLNLILQYYLEKEYGKHH